MQRTHLFAIAAATAALQGCASVKTASPADPGVELKRPEASIAFANQRSAVTSWQADGRQGLWIQDGRREWYYAKFINPCFGIDHAVGLGFDTGTSDRLDRYSYVIVPDERERCAIMSFTKSEPPPEGKRRSLDGEEVK